MRGLPVKKFDVQLRLYSQIRLPRINSCAVRAQQRADVRLFSISRLAADENGGLSDIHLKYREKIRRKLEAKKASATIPKISPEDEMRRFFKVDSAALESEVAEMKKRVELELAAHAEMEREANDPQNGAGQLVNALPLNKMLDIEKISKLKSAHIGALWLARYESDDSRSGVGLVRDRVSNHTVYTRGKGAPMFVLPLAHEGGTHEMFLSEFRNSQCFVTSLLEYQTKGQDARPAITITSYTHFAQEKDLVLVLAEFNKDMITKAGAASLLGQLEVLYNQSTEEQFAVVRQFNHDPQNFDIQTLIPKAKAEDFTAPAE